MTERRVVVTGIGTINPLGNNIAEFFSNLEKGVSGAAPITHFDAEKFKTKFACEVKNYDWTQHFDRKEVRKYDLFTQYALIAATQAVEDSGLDLEKEDLEQIGVIWSSGIGGLKTFFDECLGYAAGDGTPRFSPFFIPRMIADIGADELTSYNIVQQVTGLSFTLGDGVATAGATMVGQSLGAQRKDKAMAYVKASRKISMIASFLLMAVIFFARRGLALIFTEDETIIAGASLAFTTVLFGIMAQNGRVVFSGCLRGAGDVKYVAFCSLVSVAIIRPLLTYVLCYPLNQALPALQLAYTGPWIAFVIDAYIREALLYARVRRGTFLNIKL